MAALHEALKSLGPAEYNETPLDDLKPFLTNAFEAAQLIVDSVPIAPSTDSSATPTTGRSRSNTASSASSASEISLSSARSDPPPADVEALQKEWKNVKLKPSENPLGMSVYKLGAKDGKGAWFARRSVHEGLGFSKWKRGLEREFPETMKVQGGPGVGNIRGIGGERRVAYKNVEGVGKMEVYLLSAQFPGPTTPRDFVTMFLTSDQALTDNTGAGEVPRHFMVISKPCIHPETEPREGYIRGQYESVEFIREIPITKVPKKVLANHSRARSSTLGKEAILRNAARSQSNISPESEGISAGSENGAATSRARGKTISFDMSRGDEAKGEHLDVPTGTEEWESNPIEWIMITRSDPGGSVPRFMVERGTPGGIVADASKFLNWACAKDMDDFESDDEDIPAESGDEVVHGHHHVHDHDKDLHNYQTNGHLAGLDGTGEEAPVPISKEEPATNGGYYAMAAEAVGTAATMIASHTPTIISSHLPGASPTDTNGTYTAIPSTRRSSISSISTVSSTGSFASALEDSQALTLTSTSSLPTGTLLSSSDKELQKLEDKKRKLDEKLSKVREKEAAKNGDDKSKEAEALKKAEEKHQKEVAKAEEKHKREVEKLAAKKEKEARKAEDKKRKAADKDEKTRMARELEEIRAEVGVLRKEKEILRAQVGDLQAENTALAVRVGRLGIQGEEVLREVKEEVGKSGRTRTNSLKGLGRTGSFRSSTSGLSEEKRGGLAVSSS